MTSKVKWVAILFISLVMTGLTLLFLQKYLSEETQRRIAEAEPEGIAVVVFARTMAADEQVYADALALREFPEHLVSSQWLSQQQIGELMGHRLKYAVNQGEPLTRSMLVSNNVAGLSRQIPADHFAVTLPMTDVAQHNGLLTPGDKVDITFAEELMNGEQRQHTFSNLSVFNLGGAGQEYHQPVAGITLLLPAKQVASFTRYQKDDYALSVRSTAIDDAVSVWQTLAPPARILSWQGAQ